MNNTSNTNGAIILAVDEKLSVEILKRLKSIGCNPWIAGKVGPKSKKPRIYMRRTLQKHPFIKQKIKKQFDNYKFF